MRMFTYNHLYPPPFLRAKLVPVINVLHSLVQVNADLTIHRFSVPLLLHEAHLKTTSTERRLAAIPFYTVFRLQANLRRIKHQKMFRLQLKNKRKISGFKLVKRTFLNWSRLSMQPSQQVYILELYSKGKRWDVETIKVKLVHYGRKNIKYLGEFSFSHHFQMLN